MAKAHYTLMDDATLYVTQELPEAVWGKPRLTRIFNFEARQLITLYERGGKEEYDIPSPHSIYTKTGYAVAATSAMQVHNFSELDNTAELSRMHAKLAELGGHPPSIDDLTDGIGKKKLSLRVPNR